MQEYCSPHDLLITFFLFGFLYGNHAYNDQLDHNSLLSLPFKYSSSPPLNWSSIDCCHWEGISCDRTGHVTHIWLPSKGLKGNISPFIGNLTRLSHLNLSHNSLSGLLPTAFFSSLNQLKVLDLSDNHLGGDISFLFSSNGSSSNGWPASIQIVDISSNHFNGTFQSSFLQRAWNLTQLILKNNSITGPIPSSPCTNFPFVQLLDFSFNDHSGWVPSGLGGCSKLKIFRAGFNSLSGFLPHDIFSATTLEEISLPSNNLSGSINMDIANLTKLTYIELSDNRLSGKLPPNIGKLSKLKHLLLHTNSLTGSLPASLMNCTNLIRLNLRTNYFQENITNLDLSSLQQLTVLDLGNNDFTGKIPVSIHSCKFLEAIRISRNRLEGHIPPEVVQLKVLSFLSLSYNKLTNVTGAIKILMRCKILEVVLLGMNFQQESMPTDASMVGFKGFENLRFLDLSLCQLKGQLPIWLSKLRKLETLGLASNRITGSIPSWLSTLPRLHNLDLSDNLLSGEFPKELCALPAFVSPLDPDHNENSSSLSPIFFLNNNTAGPFSSLSKEILLGHNNLSGNIPIEIGRLKLLRILDLGYNSFKGNIPDQLSELTNLECLVLSANQLSGELPASLASLHFLRFLSVANNKLHGAIPSGTQLQSFDASAYEGNPGLCGAPLQNECGRSTIRKKDKDIEVLEKDDGVNIPWFRVFVALGFITGFWGVCGPLAFSRSWRVAYFEFLDSLKDRLYVTLTLSLARLHRRHQVCLRT